MKPFYVRILWYAKRVQDMHNIAKNLPLPLMKGDSYEAANWKVCKEKTLLMRFQLQSGTGSPHPYGMSLRIIKRTIVLWPMKIGVTSCTKLREYIIGKGQQLKLRRLILLERPIIMTATNLLGSWGRIRQEMVSSAIIKDPETRLPRIEVTRAGACFEIMQECLSKSICVIVLKTVLASVPTSSPYGTDWEDLWEVGMKRWNSISGPEENLINS